MYIRIQEPAVKTWKRIFNLVNSLWNKLYLPASPFLALGYSYTVPSPTAEAPGRSLRTVVRRAILVVDFWINLKMAAVVFLSCCSLASFAHFFDSIDFLSSHQIEDTNVCANSPLSWSLAITARTFARIPQ